MSIGRQAFRRSARQRGNHPDPANSKAIPKGRLDLSLVRYEDLNGGEEARQTLTARWLAILTIDALKAHGLHLPGSTDNLLAQAVAERVAEQVEGVLMPLL
jgi:hypothetical protein